MRHYSSLLFLFVVLPFFGQQKLTLEECQIAVTKNYPLAKQLNLYTQKGNFEKKVIEKGNLPKVDVNAQATYQSDVIEFPFSMPNTSIKPLNKDQYRATLDVQQLIYNGGLIKANSELKDIQIQNAKQQVNVSLYQLKTKVNFSFMTVLLLQEQNELLIAKKDLLTNKIKEVRSGVKNGMLLPSSEYVLQAELIKVNQLLAENNLSKLKEIKNLEQLTVTPIAATTIFEKPTHFSTNEIRPELELFEIQRENLEKSKELLSKSKLPKLNAFGQLGYGNPGLNMLDNSFQDFYMVGLKLNWNVFDWNKSQKEKAALDVAKEVIQTEKETFETTIAIQLNEVQTDIEKLTAAIQSDIEIIQLREKVLSASDSQLKNGAITSSDYLTELTQLFDAKSAQKMHEIQLQLAQLNYKIIKGN